MYQYTEVDQKLVDERVEQYRDQTRRFLAGELPDEEFRALRLMNGLYIQRFAPMLRVAVPYGQLTSRQTRMLAKIARDYDKGYAHISTRQNVQYNWPALEDIPDILAELATVQMHAIQTSGNCLRNVTTDQFAGVAADELVDPRPWCEIVRQWTTFHPEFAYLPRKFKIAINGSTSDRAAIEVHDIGLEPVKNAFALEPSLDAALGYYRAAENGAAEFMQEDIEVPSLLIGGDEDLLGEEAFTVDSAARFAGPYEVVMLRGGHWPHREDPEAFNEALLAFLAR